MSRRVLCSCTRKEADEADLRSALEPWLGFGVESDARATWAEVKKVAPGGPGAAAGMVDGDNLVQFAGEQVRNHRHFGTLVKTHCEAGRKLKACVRACVRVRAGGRVCVHAYVRVRMFFGVRAYVRVCACARLLSRHSVRS